jgi:3-hydroxybutyryl-CoA dehydrogenase
VIEDETEKVAIFQALGKVARPEALLASNTSSIPIMKLAAVTPQPHRVIGMHFFNPVPVLPLVELVPSLLTSPETVARAEAFAVGQLNKHIVHCKDRAGFVVNALLIPYLLASIRMVESGFATAADVDTGMVDGCAHPMGPLALSDLIGLDTVQAVAQSLYAEFKEPLYAPPPLLLRMVEAGLLGRKTGRGFFDYSKEECQKTTTAPALARRGRPRRGRGQLPLVLSCWRSAPNTTSEVSRTKFACVVASVLAHSAPVPFAACSSRSSRFFSTRS